MSCPSTSLTTQSFTKLILKNGVVEVQQMSTLELGVAVRAINTALQKQADLCGCRAEATLSVGRSVVLRGRLGGRLDSGERTRPGLGVRRERLVL